jgi:hypothetical protein
MAGFNTMDEVEELFKYHPADEVTGPLHEAVRETFQDTAEVLFVKLPQSANKTIALRKLQEAMWAANACVALDGNPSGI